MSNTAVSVDQKTNYQELSQQERITQVTTPEESEECYTAKRSKSDGIDFSFMALRLEEFESYHVWSRPKSVVAGLIVSNAEDQLKSSIPGFYFRSKDVSV